MDNTNQIDQEQKPAVSGSGRGTQQAFKSKVPTVKLVCDGAPFNIIVGVLSKKALTDNPNRNYLLIQNNGAANVFVGFKSKATTSLIKIIPGGNYEPWVVPTGSVHLISTAANQSCVVFEGVK